MSTSNDNEMLIRQLVENWARAVRKRDIDAILAHHAADMIIFDVPEPFRSIGIDDYRKTWELFFKYTEPGIFDIRELKIFADENIAFCIATMKCSDKSNSTAFIPLDFRLTIGLKKFDGQWIIVHEHHSIPSE